MKKRSIKLALWCTRYSPLVTPDPPDGVFIDVAGSAHLFSGEAALLSDLVARLNASGISARAAVADTPGCAWAVARSRRTRLVSPGRVSEAMASFPVAALRLPRRRSTRLHDVGIERVAQLHASRARPSAALRRRRAAAPRPGARPRRRAADIADPARSAALRIALCRADRRSGGLEARHQHGLSKPCAVNLETKGVGARRLDLVFQRVDNVAQAVRIGLPVPTASRRIWPSFWPNASC